MTITTPRLCVFTSVLGGYEAINEQPIAESSMIDFICLTDDDDASSDSWTIRTVKPMLPGDPARSQRNLKIRPWHALPDYDGSIYIDNTVLLTSPPEEIFEQFWPPESGLAVLPHGHQPTVRGEFASVAENGLDHPQRIAEQLRHYEKFYPEYLGEKPYWGGLMIRDHRSPMLREAMELWFAQVLRYSRRDQLSFGMACGQAGLRPDLIQEDLLSSWFHSWPHYNNRKVSMRHFQQDADAPMEKIHTNQEEVVEQRVWFDPAMAAADYDCPVCHDDRLKRGYLRVERMTGEIEKLYRCSSCEGLTYFPLPSPNYSTHTASELVMRDYVELNAGVDIHARQVFDLCTGPHGRLLDVGCGLGFGLDFASQHLGWEAVGFEPSTYGSEGARLLGVDIRTEFATVNDDPANRFDVVYCSEVLEHVEDPWSFLRLLTSHVKDDGLLFLTTPNPERIVPGASGAEQLALLSPGFHMTLLPPDAIGGMLTVLGFKAIVVDGSQASTRVFASRTSRQPERRPGFETAYPQYLEGLVKRLQPGTPLYNGIRYRLYRWFCDRGEWQSADKWFDASLIAPAPQLGDVRSLEDFAAKYPLCVAPATYCRGMQLINDKADYVGAAQHFRATYQLCRKKIEIDRSTSVVEEDILYQALFHEALALSYAKRNSDASRVLNELFASELSPPVPPGVLERARSLQLVSAA